MKKYFILFLLIISLLLPYVVKEKGISIEYQLDESYKHLERESDFDAAEYFYNGTIKNSTGAVVAEFSGYEKENSKRGIWSFKKLELIYGDIPDDEILVTSTFQSGYLWSDSFVVGDKYLLFLNRDNSVFYDSPRYTLMGNTIINLDDIGISTWMRGTISFSRNANVNNITDHYKSIALEKGYVANQYEDTIFRNKTEEHVFKNSEAVFKVKVLGKLLDGELYDNSTYSIEVVDAIKGGEYIGSNNSGIIIHVTKDALEINAEYIIALSLPHNKSDKYSSFKQSSDNAIISVEDYERVEKIYEWLK